jgi:O-antigen/teichoic acid export membrane protein
MVGTQFLTLTVLARILDPEAFGLLGMALVVTGFAIAFADFGLSKAIIHHQHTTRRQLSSLYWLNLAVGWGVCAAIWLVTPLVVAYYREPALEVVLRWSAGIFLFIPLGQQFVSLLERDMHFRTVATIKMAGAFVNTTVAIGLALSGFGVMSLVGGLLCKEAIIAAGLLVVAARAGWLPYLHFARADLTGFVGFGLFQMGERSINYLASNVDYLIIGRFLGAEPLGYYTLAYNLMIAPLRVINPAVTNVAFPAFARVQKQNDLLRRGYGKIVHYLCAANFPLLAGLMVVAPTFVVLVYGNQWMPAVPVLQAFCVLGMLKAVENPIGSLLLAKGRADVGFYLNVLAIVGYTLSNLLGVRWGIVGVALSSLLFTLIVLVPIGLYIRWYLVRMTWWEYWQAINKPITAAFVMVLVTVMVQMGLQAIGEIPVFLVVVVVGAITYIGTLWLLDRQLFGEVWHFVKPASSQTGRLS